MKIGEVAAVAGVPTATVRYYERQRLIAPPPRTAAGYRHYGPDVTARLRFIKHARELGFSLEEIQQMLELRVDDPAACERAESTAKLKIESVRTRIADLRRLERTLDRFVDACEHRRSTEPCPILAALAHEAPSAPRNRTRRRIHA